MDSSFYKTEDFTFRLKTSKKSAVFHRIAFSPGTLFFHFFSFDLILQLFVDVFSHLEVQSGLEVESGLSNGASTDTLLTSRTP